MYRDNRQPFVLEIDEETDEDIMSVLMERQMPAAITIANTEFVPGEPTPTGPGNVIVAMKRIKWVESQRNTRLNRFITTMFHDVYSRLVFQVCCFVPPTSH